MKKVQDRVVRRVKTENQLETLEFSMIYLFKLLLD